MSEQRIQAYRDQVVGVAMRQWGGDLFGSCEDGRHAYRATDDGWSQCKWCDARREMTCGECGQGAAHCGHWPAA